MLIDAIPDAAPPQREPLSEGDKAATVTALSAAPFEPSDRLAFQYEPGSTGPDCVSTWVGQDADAGMRELRYGFAQTSAGRWLAAATDQGICALDPAPDANTLARLEALWQPACVRRDDAFALNVARHALAGSAMNLRLHLLGTAFQVEVWQLLLRIPACSYTHYATLARWLARPGAARAVGSAVGANRVAVLVPCHRVLPANGAIGNYRWGSALKQRLLEREADLCLR